MAITQQQSVTMQSLWWMSLVRGVLLVLFGVVMLVLGRGVTLLAAIQLLGAYWLVGGVVDLIEGVIGQVQGSRVRAVIGAVIGIVAGFVVVSYPIISGILASTHLTIFMGFAAVVAGAAHIFSRSGRTRSLWGIILGVLYVVFGVAVVFNPLITQAIVVLLLPFWALITGGLSIVGSYRVRREVG